MKDETTDWSGSGWSVHREPGAAAPITVHVDGPMDAASTRQLYTALHHAAWCDDERVSPEDWAHTLLIALLVRAGGSIELTPDQLAPDALGGPNGSHYGFQTEITGTGVLVSVVPEPAVE
ncbi:hypothetical protein GCM10027258_81020 [Amycolatopsis stemonae]